MEKRTVAVQIKADKQLLQGVMGYTLKCETVDEKNSNIILTLQLIDIDQIEAFDKIGHHFDIQFIGLQPDMGGYCIKQEPEMKTLSTRRMLLKEVKPSDEVFVSGWTCIFEAKNPNSINLFISDVMDVLIERIGSESSKAKSKKAVSKKAVAKKNAAKKTVAKTKK